MNCPEPDCFSVLHALSSSDGLSLSWKIGNVVVSMSETEPFHSLGCLSAQACWASPGSDLLCLCGDSRGGGDSGGDSGAMTLGVVQRPVA